MRKKYTECYGVIYCTTNLINGKIYIGKSVYDDPKYIGSGNLIKSAIKKYGKENFKKDILCTCFSEEELNTSEKHFIKVMNSQIIGYNILEGGTGIVKGYKFSEERNLKMGRSLKGRVFSDETRKLQSKIRIENELAKGENNGMYGKHHTEESKSKTRQTIEENGGRKGKKNSNYNSDFDQYINAMAFLKYTGVAIIDIAKQFNCSVDIVRKRMNIQESCWW